MPGPEELILKTNAVGNRVGKPVAATGNVRTPSQNWGMFRTSAACAIQKDEGANLNVPLPDAFQTAARLCREWLQAQYRGAIPEAAQMRLEHELSILQKDELLRSAFLISRRLVQGLQESGYPIGIRTYTHSFH